MADIKEQISGKLREDRYSSGEKGRSSLSGSVSGPHNSRGANQNAEVGNNSAVKYSLADEYNSKAKERVDNFQYQRMQERTARDLAMSRSASANSASNINNKNLEGNQNSEEESEEEESEEEDNYESLRTQKLKAKGNKKNAAGNAKNNKGGAKAVTAKQASSPVASANNSLLKGAWQNLLATWGVSLLYIDLHFLLNLILGEKVYCKLGHEWVPKSMAKAGGDQVEKIGKKMEIVETGGCCAIHFCLAIAILMAIMPILFFVWVWQNPGSFLLDLIGALFNTAKDAISGFFK